MRTRPVVATALGIAATTGIGAGAARVLLHRQAAHARGVIGKPLGEQALDADRTWRKRAYAGADRVELLLLGDSIAAGLGAHHRRHTLGAQVARRTAKRLERPVRLRTAAVVGGESSMLRAQLAGLPGGYRADVAVIIVGGNDVTHRVAVSECVASLTEAIDALREQGTEVVVGTCPDLGALGAVPQPLRSLGSLASRQLAAAQRRTALAHGARVVTLSRVVGPFFVTEPDAMFAADRFHPSSAGYRRTAKALLPSVLAALGVEATLPAGHHAPVWATTRSG